MTNKIDDEEPIENPCPANPNHEYVEGIHAYWDEENGEIEVPYCINCENESFMEYRKEIEGSSNVEASEIMEKYEKEKEETHEETKRVTHRDYVMLDKYPKMLMEFTDAPLDACKSMVQYDISVALHDLFFANGKGRVLSNMGFLWLSPSGSNKTPLYEWGIMEMQKRLFEDWKFTHFNRSGGKALISSLSKKYKPENLVGGRALIMITQDEATTLAKESQSEGLSDVFETFAQAYDGQLSASNTVMRKEEVPPPCYAPMWFQGTPGFLEYVSKDFWDIGLGNRLFFLKYQTTEPKPIPKYHHSKEYYDEIIGDLEELRKIHYASFSDEAWNRYNEYQMKVIREVQSVQTDLGSMNEDFEIVSRVKIPIHVLKLAIIISASKFKAISVDRKIELPVDLEDMEDAIVEVEKYHENRVAIYKEWENRYGTRIKHESVEMLAKKIVNHYNKILENGQGYSVLKQGETASGESWVGKEDKEGKWVLHSMLLKNSHMKATGYRSFGEIIETLIERDEVVKREVSVQAKNRKGITLSVVYKFL